MSTIKEIAIDLITHLPDNCTFLGYSIWTLQQTENWKRIKGCRRRQCINRRRNGCRNTIVAGLIWTINAKNDLKEIYEYIAADSKYYANAFVEKIRNTAKRLKSYPKIGRVVPEYNRDEIREIIFQNYRIIYKISKQKIYIAAIFYSARNLIKDKKNKKWRRKNYRVFNK